MKRIVILLIIPMSIIFSISLSVQAREADSHNDDIGHHENQHHAALFAGLTTSYIDTDHSPTDFTLGIDYEYRLSFLNRLLGVGVFAEAVVAEHTEYLLGIPLALHPIGGLKALVAPGIAFSDVEEVEAHFLLRSTVAYDLHVGILSITPTVSLDIIEEHLFLEYGIALGVGF